MLSKFLNLLTLLQVAAFCGTSMAAEQLLAGQLPIGSSQQQSELLLQQTQEAADAELEVTGMQLLIMAIITNVTLLIHAHGWLHPW
jgi:hypothetical protein